MRNKRISKPVRSPIEERALFAAKDIVELARLSRIEVPAADRAEVALRLSVLVAGVERLSVAALDTVDPAPLASVSADPRADA